MNHATTSMGSKWPANHLRMLLLPCVLGEFRTQERGDEAAKQIIGLPDTWTRKFPKNVAPLWINLENFNRLYFPLM